MRQKKQARSVSDLFDYILFDYGYSELVFLGSVRFDLCFVHNLFALLPAEGKDYPVVCIACARVYVQAAICVYSAVLSVLLCADAKVFRYLLFDYTCCGYYLLPSRDPFRQKLRRYL